MSEKSFDCVLCGSCVVDMLVRPVPLDEPIGGGKLIPSDPVEVTTGGVVSNTGIAMSKLGMQVAAFSLVGDDEWASVIRARYQQEGIHTDRLLTRADGSTSTTAVLIDPTGERSFFHCVGAPRMMDKALFLENLDLFERSRMTMIGYYSLMPNLEKDLAEVLAAIRETGCQTALDAAGDGGGMQPLDAILPHLDVYVPSLAEATHQTGKTDPQEIVDTYRDCGAPECWGSNWVPKARCSALRQASTCGFNKSKLQAKSSIQPAREIPSTPAYWQAYCEACLWQMPVNWQPQPEPVALRPWELRPASVATRRRQSSPGSAAERKPVDSSIDPNRTGNRLFTILLHDAQVIVHGLIN
jgi:hypothetical protein